LDENPAVNQTLTLTGLFDQVFQGLSEIRDRLDIHMKGSIWQGNRIINPLKKKTKKPIGTGWREIMDIRTELARIPPPEGFAPKKW
jgi:hypothetical protein